MARGDSTNPIRRRSRRRGPAAVVDGVRGRTDAGMDKNDESDGANKEGWPSSDLNDDSPTSTRGDRVVKGTIDGSTTGGMTVPRSDELPTKIWRRGELGPEFGAEATEATAS